MSKIERSFQEKALLVIEAIASDDSIEQLSIHPPEDKICLELLHKLEAIYRHTHVARNPSCIKSHKAWVEELEKTYQYMHKHGVF